MKITIPQQKIKIKNIMDELISQPYVDLPDKHFNRQFGQYVKPLTHIKPPILEIYHNEISRESVGILKMKKVKMQLNESKKRWEYIFDLTF